MLNNPTSADRGSSGGTIGPSTLSVSKLGLRYGNVTAFRDVDLDVKSGEFIALLGPSGCGKTSLLRAIAGFVLPQEGEILLKGQDVANRPPRERNIGVVFQSYALFPHMTVLQNVCFGLECRGLVKAEAQKQAGAALETVGLSAFAERRPRQLSGGQQQRVALARALVIQPDLLLLDEPLGALDKQLRMRMQSELKALQRSLGVTAIFVTHDQEEALAMADRIVVMRGGTIQQIATPDTLFSAPRTGWVADFVNAGNLISGEIVEQGSRWTVEIEKGARFSGKADPSLDRSDAVLLVPFHKLKVEKAAEGSPFVVAAAQPAGLVVDLHISHKDKIHRAQLPIAQAADFPVGAPVLISAAEEDGVWLTRD
ncbi:MAG: ABC transporter ATP-binding protein [Gemmobacter sp.]|jgi:ABC-type Fe3+/spermidine/putrescine transport system ATPase subunit|nr:ABC transporter ATP-binding protein [Gemmobacter sp.]